MKSLLKLLTFILFFSCRINCDALFFDVHGVLLKTSKSKAFMRLGMKAIMHSDLQERFFEFVNEIDKEKSDKNP